MLRKALSVLAQRPSKWSSILFSNKMGKFLFWLHGVEAGKGLKFYGLPHIRRSSSAKILIGNDCTFRSSATSNLIGINRPCILNAGEKAHLSLGQGCGLSGTVIGAFLSVQIGDYVRCGANTLITDGDWHHDDPRSSPPLAVVIKNKVWLGVNVTVLKGVTIGENSVIGAGSIVTKDIPANVIAAGNPCRVLKQINK